MVPVRLPWVPAFGTRVFFGCAGSGFGTGFGTGSFLPVILTGFLGAGKTTLLQRILTERHGERIAVIENEFGETSVDADLLFTDQNEQVVELNNGCICCKVRGDLVRILSDLHRRRESGDLAFTRVIIETTGLADPAPVAQTFFVEDDVRLHYALDAIVTVVDAVHAQGQLHDHHEALEQVAFADRLLVSKTDLVDVQAFERLSARLRQINAKAPIAKVNFGQAKIEDLLDIFSFSLDAVLEIEPDFLEDVSHEHDDDVGSFVFSSRRPFASDRLMRFFQVLIDDHGPDLMRYKGVLAYAGFDKRVIVQGVHMLMSSDLGPAWKAAEERTSQLVFIGRNLPKAELTAQLELCLA